MQTTGTLIKIIYATIISNLAQTSVFQWISFIGAIVLIITSYVTLKSHKLIYWKKISVTAFILALVLLILGCWHFVVYITLIILGINILSFIVTYMNVIDEIIKEGKNNDN